MPLSPEQQRSIADLVAQVNADNVLQAAAVLRRQADEMEGILTTASRDLQFNPCGGDPVSRDAQHLFQAKIDKITAVHWAHQAEVRAAADALRASARTYGFSEDKIEERSSAWHGHDPMGRCTGRSRAGGRHQLLHDD